MTPICPKCGTVRVEALGKVYRCLEADCGHEGRKEDFDQTCVAPQFPNQHWRDPVALSMDGYDGEGR